MALDADKGPKHAGAVPSMAAGALGMTLLLKGVTLALTLTLSPLPRSEPTLTVTVTYAHCSGIGNGVLIQEAISPPNPDPDLLPKGVTPAAPALWLINPNCRDKRPPCKGREQEASPSPR